MHHIFISTQKKIFLLLVLSLILIQCNKEKSIKTIDPAFTGYISAFTSNIISNQSTIKIRLTDPVNDILPNQKIEEDLFDFSPNIEGESYWLDSQTIEFRPSKKLPQGKLFEASFFLSKLVKVPNKLKTFPFQFQILKQGISIEYEGMKPYKNDLEWQMILGNVLTNDFSEGDNLEKSFSVLQNGKKLLLNWNHGVDGKIHQFTIDSIHRTEDKSQVILQWNGNSLGFDEEGEKVFEIPPLGEFKVLNVNVNQQPEQFVTIYFSDPLKNKQDLEGLIYLQPESNIKLIREENTVKIYPSKRLKGSFKVLINDGVRNIMNYQLMQPFEKQINFTSVKPAIELIGKGVILPSSNGMIFPFKAVNLNAVNVKVIKVFENNISQFFQVNPFDGNREIKRVGRIVYKGEIALKSDVNIDYSNWNTFSIDLSKLITTEPGAIYRIHLSFTKQQSLYPCDKTSKDDLSENYFEDDQEIASYDNPINSWYYDDDYYYNSDYNYKDRNNPCKSSYYMVGDRFVSKNILASDFGIIAKSGHSNSMIIAITNLLTTKPIAGVTLDIYNFQNQLITSEKTNKEGILEIDLQKKPFLVIARKNKQRGYLKLDDGSALSLSMFDIGGQRNQKGLKGFIYGERGVWRPGDSLFLSFFLEDKNKVLPNNHPVVFELYTPQQLLYERKVKTNSLNGFYDFRTTTSIDAPTGNWHAKIKLGGTVFTKTIKIETIKPNRLKINLNFNTPFLSNNKKVKGDLEVKWLHGAVASNLKTDIELNLTKGKTSFEQYKDFIFDDPSKEFYTDNEMIFEGNVDNNGKKIIYPNFQIQDNAPGMLQAHFKIRAFENGGDFSIDRFSIPYSPYRGYVGLKVPEGKGWNGALYSNEPNIIPILTVDEDGKLVDRKGVKIEIYDIYWRWWWERSDNDNLSNYVANRKKNLIKTETINTKNGKAMYELNLGGDYYGRKFIRVIDPVTGHSAGQTFYVTYKGWWNNGGGENPGGAEMLTFSTDKKTYKVGEKIKVNIPTSKQGRTLVSLESGSKIIKYFWLDMAKGENSFELETTHEMAPNVYIHLTLIQPHNNVKNDLPIRLYGIQSVTVENPETHIEPIINMPDELSPEKNFTVNVSESSGKKMTYTLAVVDDGLLDLTRFKTPDLWSHFYAREALSVHTWDMYKYVIGAFSGKMAGLLALGGDEYLNKDGGAKANRFKPVVTFLGPFELEPNKKNKHTIKMPNYIGSVRTMVIAANNGAYGSVEKTTPVKKPLMVLATAPRVVGPGENIELPVTVFAMDKKIKDVSIRVQTNNLLNIVNQESKSIHFDREGDQVVNFNLNVTEKLGVAKIQVFVKSGGQKASYDIELDVRAPNPRITDVINAVIEPGETWNGNYTAIGMIGTNKGVVEISSIPSLKLQERLEYLMQYPHGCLEQTTSAAFPQLFLDNLLDLTNGEKMEIQENILAAINKLKSFQIYSGGLSFWPGEQNTASDWGTNYAGHFMLEAKAKGYSLPPGFISNWIKFQKQRANSWTSDREGRSSYSSSQLIQAYRLYTLALAKTPVLGAMNRMKSIKNLSLAAKWRLAAAYYLIGKKKIAENLIADQSTNIKPYKELSYSFGNATRDKAMILETLSLLGRKKDAKVILDELANDLSSNRWYSTQTTAYSLLAISKFIGTTGDNSKQLNFEYTINDKKVKKLSGASPLYQIDLNYKESSNGKIILKNTGTKTIFTKMQLEGIPLTGDKTNANNDLKINIRYLTLDEKEIDPSKLDQGTDFIAEVQIKHPGIRDDYKEMALTQIFPSGWEIRNTRMDIVNSNNLIDQPTYQDIRDDRVLTYFDLNRAEKKTFRILLNAAYLGKYYLPTVNCEAMYDNEINARKAGLWVKVVEPGEK
ncbi:MAG: MG2 domain-containing protein [Bacteroidota bacterium]